MHRKTKPVFIALFIITACFCGINARQSGRFTPYFNLDLSENIFIPSNGDFFEGGNIDASFGLKSVIKRSSLYTLYNLKYSGPGFHPPDGRNFGERSLNHIFSMQWQLKPLQYLTLRPGFTSSIMYRRFGSNETWSSGLYNTNSRGGHLAVDYVFAFSGKNATLTAKYLYRNIEFPNYTDLFTEFQNANLSSEISGGAADQKLNEVSIAVEWGGFVLNTSYIIINFKNQRIIQSDGLYSSTLQKDKNIRLELGCNADFWVFKLAPMIRYANFRSNQNYLRFKYLGAGIIDVTNPAGDVTFIDDNYSYEEISVSLPADIISSSSKWGLTGKIDLIRRAYKSRPPRDGENNYKSGKQYNLTAQFSAGIRKSISEIVSVGLVYGFMIARSNNKFETYQPCNYTGHSIGINYNVSF